MQGLLPKSSLRLIITSVMTAKKPKENKKTKLEKELEEALTAKMRLAAELENQRKRFVQDKESVSEHARGEVIANLFPVFDNFYRASSHAPEVSLEDLPKLSEDDFKRIFNYFSGLRQIEKQMEAVLKEMGLERIKTKGQEFDPALHEAISHEPDVKIPVDHVIDEVEVGWLLNNKVLRPAKVRVSKG